MVKQFEEFFKAKQEETGLMEVMEQRFEENALAQQQMMQVAGGLYEALREAYTIITENGRDGCRDEIGMDRAQADKFIRIVDELGDEFTYTQLGMNALYQIATMSEKTREGKLRATAGEQIAYLTTEGNHPDVDHDDCFVSAVRYCGYFRRLRNINSISLIAVKAKHERIFRHFDSLSVRVRAS